MITLTFDNYDIDEEYRDLFPNVELRIAEDVTHAAYLADLMRRFMLAVGYSPQTIDDYITPMDDIRSHIEDRLNEKLSELTDSKEVRTTTDYPFSVSAEKINSVLNDLLLVDDEEEDES